ncbi:MAG: magnesium transporter [Candidatus Lokiarchaeota archaeon]|nr:magnesium transporter [Candidatus Lokiarchaeota archaeon]
MEREDSRFTIVKEIFPSETLSIMGSVLAGLILSLIILEFKSFPILILLIPALLSLRGNISSPFIARTAKDLIIGQFNKRNIAENILSTYLLAIITAFLIGIFTLIINIFIFKFNYFSNELFILIPLISMLFTLSLVITISILLNSVVFKFGLDPNNIIPPIMTGIGEFFNVVFFYLTLILLGVP